MRIDHHAYQRATRVAGFGLLLQVTMGLVLLLFGLSGSTHDTTLVFCSTYMLTGVLVWLGLALVFYQHKLERLEALEEDELGTSRAESMFGGSEDDTRVAARRLRLMHKWLMPAISLLLAFLLTFLAWREWIFLQMLDEAAEVATEFHRTPAAGWALAICLGFALFSFIFSRFVAGMSKLSAWQNLRGGAGYMVGNALVVMAAAVGISTTFFDAEGSKQAIVEGIAYGLVIFQWLVAGEIVLNFILNLYRPRIPGEVPRPAFDSKVLSLLAAPDNLVRSINEAVNYQFGFDITSSWGYQLLLRSVAWLIGLGVLVALALSTMVVVEPHQQAVRLAGGAVVGEPGAQVHDSGIMWKLPWPFQTAIVRDVSRIQELDLTARRRPARAGVPDVRLWTDELESLTEFRPFMVGATTAAFNEQGEAVNDQIGLVDAEIVLQYRIRRDGGLLDFLTFASDDFARRQRLTDREGALRSLALEQISRRMASLTLDQVLGQDRLALAEDLRDQVQSRFDQHATGIEVVAITIPMIRPSGDSAASFEEMGISVQARRRRIAESQRSVDGLLATLVGEVDQIDVVLKAIDRWDALRKDANASQSDRETAQLEIDRMLREAGGLAAQEIANAERDRWVKIMSKRAEASRHANQRAAYRAAPRLYRQREIMRLYQMYLPDVRKYLLATDPSRIRFELELKELDPMFDLSSSIAPEGESQ